ncbi:MAG: NUDIX domain-containing protein [Sphingomonadaceae bacterium]|uniref:NUDIX hydrolase n=1 Tax=Thermaurantiacus sp. TaxID=2820283 RepID=UPI00298F374C|nr:NUDIX domain-containing protein [Thermaurantiacus sp.]MCS6986984.1 NUDIX domain-containing protein [Sphingomonadaceae bacterium]MDW8415415.1 NUDIX domain-containing protein [Thermaurantiacus sp.]
MEPPDVGDAVPAATVILVRDGPGGLEVLAIERAQAMGFAGGAVAFPGGKVDPLDAPDPCSCSGFEGLDPADALARVTAARETFEETGILLSKGPGVPAERRAELRQRSDRHELAFGTLLADLGHRLAAESLKPFARWVPPPGIHRRFDTRFYVALPPPDEVHAADGTEAVTARWVTPAHLLAEADAGHVSLLFPTRCNLARVAQFATAAALWADPTPPPFIQPRIEGEWLRIPEGIGYPYTAERWERVRRA